MSLSKIPLFDCIYILFVYYLKCIEYYNYKRKPSDIYYDNYYKRYDI